MPGERREWMLFVDGENLTLRAQEYAKVENFELEEGPHYQKDVFVWLPKHDPLTAVTYKSYIAPYGIRAYYYTSLTGDDPSLEALSEQLWQLRFTPRVFKRTRKGEKAKGVDISLTKDMLSHASLSHYEVACLVAGDGDYVPLVEEVKRLGKIVVVIFFSSCGLSSTLKRTSDEFFDIGPTFKAMWTNPPK